MGAAVGAGWRATLLPWRGRIPRHGLLFRSLLCLLGSQPAAQGPLPRGHPRGYFSFTVFFLFFRVGELVEAAPRPALRRSFSRSSGVPADDSELSTPGIARQPPRGNERAARKFKAHHAQHPM